MSHSSPGALILSSLARLTPSQRQSFYNLSYVNLPKDLELDTPRYNDELALAIFQTNVVSAGPSNVGIFPRMARMNHGCSKAFNAVYFWRENEHALVVHALKDIKKGQVRVLPDASFQGWRDELMDIEGVRSSSISQELLTTYTDTKRPRSERR